MNEVTRILSAIEQGDTHAAAQLLLLVYDELRRLVAAKRARDAPRETLQTTALVHEAYLRLLGVAGAQHFSSRGHFFTAAAEAMRRILIENARRKKSHKGDRKQPIDLDEMAVTSPQRYEDLLALDEALSELATIDPQAAALVKLRYFAGLTVAQAAEVLAVSPRNADFLWAYARAWLLRRLGDDSATT
jgi:RNA polymerase sigma factor (TIGR02999 family)